MFLTEKKFILLFYVLGFAVLNFERYIFRSESGFFFGSFEILVILLFPFGALIYDPVCWISPAPPVHDRIDRIFLPQTRRDHAGSSHW